MSCRGCFADAFVKKGFTAVTFDYRGFGKSSDFPIGRSNLYPIEFTYDLITVVKETDRRFPHKRIGVRVLSMGTMILTRAMESIKKNPDFAIGDGFVAHITKVAERIRKVKNDSVKWPESNEVYQRSLSNLKLPFLTFAASKEPATTASDAQNIKSKINASKCEIIIYEGKYLRGFQAGTEPFGEQVVNFLKKQLFVSSKNG